MENGPEAWGLQLSHNPQLTPSPLPTPPAAVHPFLPQFCKHLVIWAQRTETNMLELLVSGHFLCLVTLGPWPHLERGSSYVILACSRRRDTGLLMPGQSKIRALGTPGRWPGPAPCPGLQASPPVLPLSCSSPSLCYVLASLLCEGQSQSPNPSLSGSTTSGASEGPHAPLYLDSLGTLPGSHSLGVSGPLFCPAWSGPLWDEDHTPTLSTLLGAGREMLPVVLQTETRWGLEGDQ